MIKKIFVLFVTIILFISNINFANVINQNDAIANQAQATIDAVSTAINSTYSVVDSFNNSALSYGTITFGSYQQGNSLEEKTPIEWYILEKREDKAILMSKYVLDVHRYDNKINSNWKETSIGKWLNGMFFDSAFNNSEKQMIIANPYKAVGNVFLLNLAEAESYFNKNDTFLSRSHFTTYARQTKPTVSNSYWLDSSNGVSSIFINDYYDGNNKYIELDAKIGVRPCIVLKYNVNNTNANNTAIANTTTTTTTDTANNNAPIYIADVVPDVYTYGYDDDNDKHHNMQITIKHPVFASGNQQKAAELNNIYTTIAKEIVKVNTNDYIDEHRITNKQILVNATDFHKEDDYNYTLVYLYGASRTMFKLHINLAINQCYIEY